MPLSASLYGSRTFPRTLDEHAASTPDRPYAAIALDDDPSKGFLDISCSEMARCANFMAHSIINEFGRSNDFETLAFIGIADIRHAPVFLGAVKAGYKLFLPSTRNPPQTTTGLMQQTRCSKLLFVPELASLAKDLVEMNPGLICANVPTLDEMLKSKPEHVPFEKTFKEAKNEPIVILHSSGSTGLPKPITMTHGTFAVLDNERNLPDVPGRLRRDYSMWDLKGERGGRTWTPLPYSHLSGFLSTIVNPIFTELSIPVLGRPSQIPSGALLKKIMLQQDIRIVFLPPIIAEQLVQLDGGLEFLKGLDYLCYTGGPLASWAGEKLSEFTELCPLYGSTEAFQVPRLKPAPEDWAWMEWNPHFKLEMKPQDDEAGSFELVLFADEKTEKISALNHNAPGVSVWHTKDLFIQHPKKPGLWQYHARKDDIINLTTSCKFNPIATELHIQSHPDVIGALIIGNGRSHAALLIEPHADLTDSERTSLPNSIWPIVEEANGLLPVEARIPRGNLIIAKQDKPFPRAAKGTVVRKLTEQLYGSEISDIYR